METVVWIKPLVGRNEQAGADVAQEVEEVEGGFLAQADIVDDLGEQSEVAQKNKPELVAEEVVENEVEEEAEVELDIEGSEFFPEELGVFDVGDVVTAPHQEQHLHVENDEEHDVGEGGQDEVEVAALSVISVTYEPMMYWMCSMVEEKSSMLHSDSVSRDSLPAKARLGPSITRSSIYALHTCKPITALTYRL